MTGDRPLTEIVTETPLAGTPRDETLPRRTAWIGQIVTGTLP